ncbi:S24 family peptidase [uncultured Porphyromonas sp.]|uniref:S24 family peptidase n=1 Tax=uncultured Porphyromonas sp. TaxID=159274 RepID=UPI00259A35B0|nr:S24 family peptidase [uncultured Porphyromonas sp.]
MERRIERFDQYMSYKGLNDNQVTMALGLSIGTIGKSRGENRDLSNRVVELILNFYTDLNRNWLLTGEGTMLKAPKLSGEAEILMPEEVGEFVKVPVVPYGARAGVTGDYEQIFASEEYEAVMIPKDKVRGGKYLVFTVTGDSMEPELRARDRILAKHVEHTYWQEMPLHIHSYRVWVLITRDEGILTKQIVEHNVEERTVRLHSFNPIYPDFTISLEGVLDIFHATEIISRQI